MAADREVMPLHAQVAAALGWTMLLDRGDGLWLGVQPETGLTMEVPPYGRSWCSTGPLCERMRISVFPGAIHPWGASMPVNDIGSLYIEADTPCEAIARVVVEINRKKKK